MTRIAIVLSLTFTVFASDLFADQLLQSRRITLQSLPRAAVAPAVLESHAIPVILAFHTSMPSQSQPQPAQAVPAVSLEGYWSAQRIAGLAAVGGGVVVLKALSDCAEGHTQGSDGCSAFLAFGMIIEVGGAIEAVGADRIDKIPASVSRPIHWIAVGRRFLRR
jgi:hypothetical protein